MSIQYEKSSFAALQRECDTRTPEISCVRLGGLSAEREMIQRLVKEDVHVRKAKLGSHNFNQYNDPTGEDKRARIREDGEFRRKNTGALLMSEINYHESMVKNARNTLARETAKDAVIENAEMKTSLERTGFQWHDLERRDPVVASSDKSPSKATTSTGSLITSPKPQKPTSANTIDEAEEEGITGGERGQRLRRGYSPSTAASP